MKRTITILIVLAILGVGGYFGLRYLRQQQNAQAAGDYQTTTISRGNLTATVGATGTVRANQTAVLNWQTSGTVGEIKVKPGEMVQAGGVLATLKSDTLAQNIILASNDLVNAQKALDDLLNSKLPQAQALKTLEDARNAINDRELNLNSSQAQALLALTQAQDALNKAQSSRDSLNVGRAKQSDLEAAEADYILAQDSFKEAEEKYNQVSGRPEDDLVRALALSNLSTARARRDAALRRLNWLNGQPSEQDVKNADAKLAQAQAQLAEAQQRWDEIKDGLSAADIALLEARLADAEREYDRIKDGANQDDIAVLEARIAAAQATLKLAHIEAPFAGTITDVDILPGDQAAPGKAVFRLDDLSRLLVDVRVSEVDINRVQLDQKVTLNFDAILGSEYNGKVIEVARVGSLTQGIVEFTVTVELTDFDEKVRPGMTAAVNIVVEELNDVLLVPNRAVRVVSGQRAVYILKNGVLQPVKIVLGPSSDNFSQLVKGDLREGDTVVLNPPQEFDSGGPPPFVQR